MKHVKNTRLISLVFLFATACGQSVETSHLSHDVSTPVRDGAAWNWANISEVNHEHAVLGEFAAKGFVPANSNLVKRAQFWVDRLDALVRDAHPAEMAGVPKPKVKMIKQAEFNAFIANVYSCFNLPLEIDGRSGGRDSGLYIDLANGGELTRWNDTDPNFGISCVDEPDLAVIKTALEEFNSGSATCQFSISANKVVASANCPLAADMSDAGGIASGGKIVIGRTSSWVNIFTGLIEELPNEEQFVSVMSHELGHYYRSHITAKLTDYGFFYSMGDRNPDHRPEPRPDLKEFGDQVYLGAETVNVDGNFAAIPGQTISPRVYLAAGDLALQSCRSGSCADSCSAVAALINDSRYKSANKYYPFGSVPAVTDSYFQKFETKAITCLGSLAVGANAAVTPAMIHQAIEHPRWFGVEPGLAFYPEQAVPLVESVLANLGKRTITLPAGANALEVLKALGKQLDKDLTNSMELLTKARNERLGQYTEEQEADELAVEWTAGMGLPLTSMEATNMTIAALGPDDEMGGMLIGGTKCKALQDAGWKDPAGNDIFVPIGDFSEVHHSACFRAFNTHRELGAHQYVQGSRPTTALPGGAWSAIKAQAARINHPFRRPGRLRSRARRADSQVIGRSAALHMKSCVISQGHID